MKLFLLHGRQRCLWHVSTELLPCKGAAAASSAAASKGERMLRLSARELELPCKALGDEGSLSALAAVAGRGSPGPVPAGSAAAMLEGCRQVRMGASPGAG